jgi:endonuclease G
MKKVCLVLLLVLSLLSGYSQTLKRDSVYIKTSIFELVYSEVLEQPKWVKYTVMCPNGTASRTGMEFYTNDSVHTSNTYDYIDNVWDRGHIAPAADFNCDSSMLYKTFTYMNCTLQHQDLNRGVWKWLEFHERKLALSYTVKVEVRAVYSKKSIKLATGATVPNGFYKIIKYNNKIEKYYFPNKTPLYTDYKKYLIK